MGFKKNKNFYAVVSGQIDEPMIFSSWGDAYPRVTGCKAVYKGFPKLESARKYMAENGISEYREVIKYTAEDTTPKRGSTAYYAVAHGAKPGIKPVWYEVNGALEETREISDACYKRFNTEAQAEAFIEDWKKSYAEVARQAVRKRLDGGLRPRDMSLNVEGLLQEGGQVESLAEQLGTRLRLDES